jgi:micrococcal nuclease
LGWVLAAVLVAAVTWVPVRAPAAGEGARRLAPSGRGLGSRVVAPQPRTAEDVLAARPASVMGRPDWPLDFVTHVIDGDTVRLRERGVVRLIGVDTPETKHPRKPIERCGPEASAFTRAAIEKRWVSWEQDREARDKYGRWLAYVHREPDRFFLNAELVRQGAGRAYIYFPFRLRNWFVELEQAAKRDGLGIWGPHAACDLPEARAALATTEDALPAPPLTREAGAPPQANAPPPPEAPTMETPGAETDKQNAPTRAARHRTEPAGETPAASTRSGHRPGCDIKGNIGSGGERIYHLPGGSHYRRTKVDEDKGERWFCSEAEAREAGWRPARN